MPRIIDLSTPIVADHFRWRVERRLPASHAAGDGIQATWAGWPMHGFTHMDTPRHFAADGFTTDQVALDRVMGEAAVVDLAGIAPETAITEAMIAAAGRNLREGDIALVRTGWDTRESLATPAFWTRAPYMTEAAAVWLRRRGIKAVAWDFPQDYCIRHYVLGDRKPAFEENTTHLALLLHGVLMFEYLCNMMAIRSPRPTFIGLPLKLPDADGAPVRAVAIESD
jgi:kynurenine formamidase